MLFLEVILEERLKSQYLEVIGWCPESFQVFLQFNLIHSVFKECAIFRVITFEDEVLHL